MHQHQRVSVPVRKSAARSPKRCRGQGQDGHGPILVRLSFGHAISSHGDRARRHRPYPGLGRPSPGRPTAGGIDDRARLPAPRRSGATGAPHGAAPRRRTCAPGWTSAYPICDAADEIAMRWFRRDVPTSTKPDRHLRHRGRPGDRAAGARAHPGRASGPRPGGRGVRRGGRRGPDPLVHRPDRRDPQLHPRRAALRDAPGGGGGRRAPGRDPERPRAGRALACGPRPGRLGDRARRRQPTDPDVRRHPDRRRPAGLRQPPGRTSSRA